MSEPFVVSSSGSTACSARAREVTSRRHRCTPPGSGVAGGVEQILIELAHGLSSLEYGDEEYLFLTSTISRTTCVAVWRARQRNSSRAVTGLARPTAMSVGRRRVASCSTCPRQSSRSAANAAATKSSRVMLSSVSTGCSKESPTELSPARLYKSRRFSGRSSPGARSERRHQQYRHQPRDPARSIVALLFPESELVPGTRVSAARRPTRESGGGLRQPPARKKIPSIWSILPDTGSPKPGSTDARVNPIPARYPNISR